MEKEDRTKSRREFLKKSAFAGALISVPFGKFANADDFSEQDIRIDPSDSVQKLIENGKHQYNGTYSGEYISRVAFPIGGIGAGMFCLEGTGAISHMSFKNYPDLLKEPKMFAAISIKNLENGAKVLEGPVPNWKRFGTRGAEEGSKMRSYGLPRFDNVEFKSQFPFGEIKLSDKDIPLDIKITGWSPFIPTDEDNSSLPVAAIEYKFKNNSSNDIGAVFSYNSDNFVTDKKNNGAIKPLKNGFILEQFGTEEKPWLQSEFAIYTDDPKTMVDHCWFRGEWFDPLSMVWKTISEVETKENEAVEGDAPGASLFVPFKLSAGEEKTIRIMMSWYVPGSDLQTDKAYVQKDCDGSVNCCNYTDDLFPGTIKKTDSSFHKPWYTSKFRSIKEIVAYWEKNYNDLKRSSHLFTESFYKSTLPNEVIEAIAANLSILKSPTIMRQFDGRIWYWEGLREKSGCCPGSCTHVYNYAQAMPSLFPKLERTLRNTEFCESQGANGHQKFRTNLPISPGHHWNHAASDGQLGGIMKVYREWRISGDNEWMKTLFPLVKKSMDFCITLWDPKRKGIIEEPHHNTYDIEFWGPDGMNTSFYLGALVAFQKMGVYMNIDVSKYAELYEKGKAYMEKELYDGEFFIQKIQWEGLETPNPLTSEEFLKNYSPEALELLEKEGPKYQYGNGCLSDGVLGSWIAQMCGLENPIDDQKTKSHLLAVHKYNLKHDLSDHVNPQRPSYALGKEGGLLLCSWPKGGKLTLPFVYSNEVWTGIEYQVASHLMINGEVEKGLEIVRTCRDRYDGRIRNPFNEYECGNWYGRAMSSYGLIQGLTGLRYDAVDKTLYIDSKIGDFTSFISTETGFGTVTFKNNLPKVDIVFGNLKVDKIMVSGKIV